VVYVFGRQRFLIGALIVGFIGLLTLSCSVHVQALPDVMPHGNISMRVSPTYITAEVRDGDLIGPIKVSNTGSLTLDLQGFISKGSHDENGVPIFSEPMSDTLRNSVFLTLEPAKFRLRPGESRWIKVKAHVSPTFSGGAYPIIVFQGQPVRRTQSPDLLTGAQVGVLTLITVTPRRKQEPVYAAANIESVSLSQDPINKSVTVSAICKNQGNIHTHLSGTAVIRSCLGQPASVAKLTAAVCLPGHRRMITARFEPFSLNEGIYIAEVLVNAEGNTFPSVPVAFQVARNGMIDMIHMDLAHP
jgi:hypothetical protein